MLVFKYKLFFSVTAPIVIAPQSASVLARPVSLEYTSQWLPWLSPRHLSHIAPLRPKVLDVGHT